MHETNLTCTRTEMWSHSFWRERDSAVGSHEFSRISWIQCGCLSANTSVGFINRHALYKTQGNCGSALLAGLGDVGMVSVREKQSQGWILWFLAWETEGTVCHSTAMKRKNTEGGTDFERKIVGSVLNMSSLKKFYEVGFKIAIGTRAILPWNDT